MCPGLLVLVQMVLVVLLRWWKLQSAEERNQNIRTGTRQDELYVIYDATTYRR